MQKGAKLLISNKFDQNAYRSALGHFPTGVAIVTASTPDGHVGMTLQAFMSLSLDPALILLAVDRVSTTWPKVATSGTLAVNVLSEHQSGLAKQFARSGTDKFAGVELLERETAGAPLIAEALVWFDCTIVDTHPGGDHTIAVCAIDDFRAPDATDAGLDPKPLLFYRSGFPKLARPMFLDEQSVSTSGGGRSGGVVSREA